MTYNDPNTRRDLIMHHYSSPLHKKSVKGKKVTELYSKQCVDNIKLHLDVKEDIVNDAYYEAEGCAVFLSSVDIMVDKIIGKSKEEIKILIEEYENVIHGRKFNHQIIGPLAIYKDVEKQLNRLHCAEMISDVLKKSL